MVWSFLIPAAATLLGARQASKATKEAAATSAASADKATELQRQMYEESVARQQPFLQTGTEFFNRLAALQRGGPEAQQQFLQMDPGYGFRLSEGLKAMERGAAARGGLMSGAALKAGQRYGQDLGSQEDMNAFNRYQAERQARLGPLQSLAGVGQTATQALGSAAGQYGSNIGNIMMGQGQTAANAALARGSAYAGGLNQLGYLAGRYYGQPGNTGYMAPVETRDLSGAGEMLPISPYGP